MKVLKTRVVIPVIIIVCVGALLGIAVWWLNTYKVSQGQTAHSSTLKTANKTQEKPATPSLRFAAMGDMLAHDSVVANAKTENGYDFTRYFTRVQNLYNNADVVFCNPETLATGASFGVSGYPTFNASSEIPCDLNKIGCNLINLATNHIGDKSQDAKKATLTTW